MEHFVIIINGFQCSILGVAAALDPPLKCKKSLKLLVVSVKSEMSNKTVKKNTFLTRRFPNVNNLLD